MTHAERVREAERAVVEAAVAQAKASTAIAIRWGMKTKATEDAANALLAMRAETCPECGGEGFVGEPRLEDAASGQRMRVQDACHADCDNGRRRA